MVCCGGLMATRSLLEDGMGSIFSEFTPLNQYRLSEHVVRAIGCLFTVAGQNTQDVIDQMFTVYDYWSMREKVILR